MACLRLMIAAASIFCLSNGYALAEEALAIETKISLGPVTGRIDHLAVDLPRHRLFVAELGNNSVGVVDLKSRKLIRTIYGLNRPQGVGYHSPTDMLYVANAGDASVRIFHGSHYSFVGRIDLHGDADNIRIDTAANRIFVGYGEGALAVIDAKSRRLIANIKLPAHPEGFQLDKKGGQILINTPDVHAISDVDQSTWRLKATWPVADARANFPMAIDEANERLAGAFRNPPVLRTYSLRDGKLGQHLKICGDADDVFFDTKRKRMYISCGEGFIDVIDTSNAFKRIAHIGTARGARTSLFDAECDRLYLAVRGSSTDDPAIWIYRPID